LTGLDSVPYIWPYFRDRKIDLAYFAPDDTLVADLDGRTGKMRPKLMHRASDEFVVYHPNAREARLPPDLPERERRRQQGRLWTVDHTKTARMRVDMTTAPGTFQVEWYRPYDGAAESSGTVNGGTRHEFAAPWKGYDVVLRLLKKR
jgi:hypothetical protein